jgi:hypothetical protein
VLLLRSSLLIGVAAGGDWTSDSDLLLAAEVFFSAVDFRGDFRKMLATLLLSCEEGAASFSDVLGDETGELALVGGLFLATGDGDFLTGETSFLSGLFSSSESLSMTPTFLCLDLAVLTGESPEASSSASMSFPLVTTGSEASTVSGEAAETSAFNFFSACNGGSGSLFRLNVFRAKTKAKKTG